MRVRARAGAIAAAVVAVVTLTACHGTASNGPAASATTVARPERFVVVGSDLTLGDGLDDPIRDAWPRLVFAQSFPLGSFYTNVAGDQATAADAVSRQAPLVEQLRPEVTAILLGADDVRLHTPTADFSAALEALVNRVKAASTRVLLGDIPAVGVTAADAAPYNLAIGQVASDTGVPLVELSSIGSGRDSIAAGAGDAAEHRAIARAFEAALAGR